MYFFEIIDQLGFLRMILIGDVIENQQRVTLGLELKTLISMVRFMPTIRTSYSNWLLGALNLNLKYCSIRRLSGPSKTILTLLPFKFEAPFTDIIHMWWGSPVPLVNKIVPKSRLTLAT